MNDGETAEHAETLPTGSGLLLSVEAIRQARTRDSLGESDGGSSGKSVLNDNRI